MPETERPTSAEPIARRLLVGGRVQGVGYRAATQREAARLGLDGWVRNLHDGSVEILAAGSEAAVEALIDWTRRGPVGANVTRVEIAAADAPASGGFQVLPTA